MHEVDANAAGGASTDRLERKRPALLRLPADGTATRAPDGEAIGEPVGTADRPRMLSR